MFTHGRCPRCEGQLGCPRQKDGGSVARPLCDTRELETEEVINKHLHCGSIACFKESIKG